jgi:hypothetical protein
LCLSDIFTPPLVPFGMVVNPLSSLLANERPPVQRLIAAEQRAAT